MKITMLGCGRWGGFIAWYLDHYNHDVKVWGLESDPYVQSFFATRTNDYLTFPESIALTTSLGEALSHGEYVIISISAQHVRSLMANVSKIDGYKDKKYILCMKGIEDATGKRLSEVLIEAGVPKDNIAVWVGPGHVQEFLRGVANCMIIDSYNKDLSAFLVKSLRTDLIRFYQGQDMIGTEIGAAAKNVMGIAAGMLDGAGMSVLKGALMARGAHEISVLMEAMGGNRLSAYGLCHLGDYEATLFSLHSHNRMFGESFVRHAPFTRLAEGVATSSALLKMAKEVNVELPITKAVNDIITKDCDPREVLDYLLSRSNLNEF